MVANENQQINLSENAIKVLEKRYLKRDANGNPTETPEDMFKRVATTITKGDLKYGANQTDIDKLVQKFYDSITNFYFMPNSPTLMNAGRELGQLAACFVLPIEDTLEGIFETIKNTALIHKSGGGTGFSFSRLRPKNDVVRSTMGVSSGPVSFMEVFNAATEAVKQGGTRRGANMGILRVDHPDILEFINCKSDTTKLNNFNISVAITDKFMDAYLNNRDYELIHPNTKQAVGSLNAKEIFDKIVDCAWRTGEPGIVFIDTMNYDNPTPQIGEIESTNPCGEVPLLPYEACNLGSINLSAMLKEEDENISVDWDLLRETTRTAIRFLDNVITINNYPLPQIEEMVSNNRKIGLGIMGWANMLMKLGISYASEDGTKLAAQIMEFIDYESKCESVELAKERGRFKNFTGSIYDSENYLYNKFKGKSAGKISDEQWKALDEEIKKYGIRNATTTCIAPTGTISMIAGVSGGIEPLFGLVFLRLIMDNTEMLEVNPIFEEYLKKHNIYSEELIRKTSIDGSVAHIENISDEVKQIFVTAHDISPYWHVKMQAAFQLHTDNAVSKTVNFVESATREDIENTYVLAYKNHLKGITVYRNNSRTFQPMNLGINEGEGVGVNSTDEVSEEPKSILSDEYNPTGEIKTVICPECGNKIEMAEGCFICLNCGYSGCA
ncbi:MAG: adenosylcobalamin-dependent ribonucleoside-diphosphate reductase [Candidatus Gastranaerophilales bacterium]|nr:adenosylcobalamin-dependent ribonucleoside-diphosphate reductase [Candidatus Gastranaerophilales bacterium]